MENRILKPKQVRVIRVIEITYEANATELLPNREVKEYQKLDGSKICLLDPYSDLSSSISNASYVVCSEET